MSTRERHSFYGLKYEKVYHKHWRAVVNLRKADKRPSFIPDNVKAYTVGYFATPLEAAKAYDEFVRKHSLSNRLNFDEDGNRLPISKAKLPKEDVDFIRHHYYMLDIDTMADLLGVTKSTVLACRPSKKQLQQQAKQAPLLIITSEEDFDAFVN